MRIVYATHSLRSCWNHGNAHFLRGVLRELIALGHDAVVVEPEDAWSVQNLVADHGPAALAQWQAAYPELTTTPYAATIDPAALVDGADLVIVHEWNDPAFVAAIGRLRAGGARFRLLFHDTHHRAVSDPDAMRRYDLSGYDGVLAFGAALADVYRGWGWGARAFTWHEAADIRLFHPPTQEGPMQEGPMQEGPMHEGPMQEGPMQEGAMQERPRTGAVWVGNWGDGERTAELESFLLGPARAAGLKLDIHGVRYPAEARALLARYGARYHGWAPNHRAPEIFAQRLMTVHVPRRFYATVLPGIPTIRVFEALACGIPLASAPWDDAEGLFTPGSDYLVARDGAEMTRHLGALAHDPALRRSLAAHGLATIGARHTCAHRVGELLRIVQAFDA